MVFVRLVMKCVGPWLARTRLHCFMRLHHHKNIQKPNRIEMNNCWKEITIILQMKTQLHGIIQLAECKTKRINSTWMPFEDLCALGACWLLDSRQFSVCSQKNSFTRGTSANRLGIAFTIVFEIKQRRSRAHSAHTKRWMRKPIQIVLSHGEMHFIILRRENGKNESEKNTANVLTTLSVRTHRSISCPPANRVKKRTHRDWLFSPVYCSLVSTFFHQFFVLHSHADLRAQTHSQNSKSQAFFVSPHTFAELGRGLGAIDAFVSATATEQRTVITIVITGHYNYSHHRYTL